MFGDQPTWKKNPWRVSWVSSALLHAAVGVALIVSVALAPFPTETPAEQIQLDGRWSPATKGSEADELRAADAYEGWSDVIESSPRETRMPDSSTVELSSLVRRQIDRSVADGRRRATAENEDKLSRLSRRLSETSNRENVDQMAEFLSGFVDQRTEEPNPENADRPFEVETAQIDRVRKEVDAAGKDFYIATLIDAKGAKKELELDAESGSQLYKTMKLIEANPLLKQVYRRIVMGFLDQMLRDPTKK